MENKKDNISDTDDFWKLDDLMPRRHISRYEPSDTNAVDIEFGDEDSPPLSEAIRADRSATHGGDVGEWLRKNYSAPHGEDTDKNAEVTSYVPKNPLITRVTVVKRNGYIRLAERMLLDMHRLFDREALFTKNVPYASYFPQYSRMTEEQLNCYIGFRSAVRRGNFPTVSESYIYMLLYEIINMTERISAEEGAGMFCSLMVAYRKCSDALFTNMCDWLEDLCLINGIECPFAQLETVRERICKLASWKEFYIPFHADGISPDTFAMLNAASSYDYKKSHFYSSATAKTYDRHIPAAFDAVISRISGTDPKFSPQNRETTRLTREAFRGALRSPHLKRTVTVECVCFTRSPLLRQTVTAIIRAAENYVRELLGIRSRITVNYLGADKKQIMAEYFEPFLRQKSLEDAVRADKEKTVEAEYEKLYEPQNTVFSPKLAMEIERASWNTTDLLLRAFNSPDDEPTLHVPDRQSPDAPSATQPNSAPPTEHTDAPNEQPCAPNGNGNGIALEALGLLLSGDKEGFFRLASSNAQMPETLADAINELAYDAYGDIGVTVDNGVPCIEEEYRDELEHLVNENT